MREILFRGKRTDNGEWIEGAFCPKDCDSPFAPMVDRPSIIKLDDPCSGYWFEVDAESVGQYTGLKDKNGKRIFEGDILRVVSCEYNYTTSVGAKYGYENGFYVDGDFGDGDYTVLDWAVDYWQDDGAEIEIIGNIHDNPELLGGTDDGT